MFLFCIILNIIIICTAIEIVWHKYKPASNVEKFMAYAFGCAFSITGPLASGVLGGMFFVVGIKFVAEWIANQIKKKLVK